MQESKKQEVRRRRFNKKRKHNNEIFLKDETLSHKLDDEMKKKREMIQLNFYFTSKLNDGSQKKLCYYCIMSWLLLIIINYTPL